MAEDNDKANRLPWIYRVPAAGAAPSSAGLDPHSAVYRLFRNTRNPYLRRALAPAAAPERTARERQRLFRLLERHEGYRVSPRNTDWPHRRRSLEHRQPPAAPPRPHYPTTGELPGDPTRLPILVHQFFASVLGRLEEDPQSFFAVVEELTRLFRHNGLRVRVYEAYHALESWDDLMTTLEEIARYPAQETFDLFCGALFAYAELVEPPPEP